jgi:hypothetical protein
MNKENLVVLKGNEALKLQTDTMYPNKYYRCLKASENDNVQYCIYGIIFDQEGFDKYFEFAYDRIMRDWERIGLLKNGKAISKTAFKELANVDTYGKKNRNLRIIFFGLPKECMYGFYPPFCENKSKQLDNMYQWYGNVINASPYCMSYFDGESIQFGNCGIPIVYTDRLRVK